MSVKESRSLRWARLLDEEQEAFEKARANSESDEIKWRAYLAREWFDAAARLLEEHARSHVVIHEGGPLSPYPGDAIYRVALLMRGFATGRLFQAVEDAIGKKGSGGRPDGVPQDGRSDRAALLSPPLECRRPNAAQLLGALVQSAGQMIHPALGARQVLPFIWTGSNLWL